MVTDPESRSALSATPCESPLCRSQDVDLTDSVEIDSLKAGSEGWQGHGVIHLNYCVHGKCRTCGRIFEAATREIPILFPELTCVTCEKQEYLQYKVRELTRTEDGYEFSVSIRCSHCARTGTLTKMLKGLLHIFSIEVGLTGISIKAAAPKQENP